MEEILNALRSDFRKEKLKIKSPIFTIYLYDFNVGTLLTYYIKSND